MKKQMTKPPTLTAPIQGETLIMYLSMAKEAISTVLFVDTGVFFLSRTENLGRLAKWAIELSEHDISYRPRTLIRGQVLADFLAEIPTKGTNQVEEATTIANEAAAEVWKLFTDGSSNEGGSRARLILTSPEGIEFTYDLRFEFNASNNEAVNEELLAGLRIAEIMRSSYSIWKALRGNTRDLDSIWEVTGQDCNFIRR
ncbi:hypothetical protein Tco_0631635 [Tanacetum coccineum]